MAGRRIVEMVNEDLRLSQILTKKAFENAIMVNGAIGGSTNAVVHLLAIAGRVGVELSLDDWDRLGREMPCLVNLMPSGKYLMEDFYYAGGLPVVIKRDRQVPAQEGADGERQVDLGERARTPSTTTRRDHAAREAVQAAPASRCCAATWRRMAA
jgi:dihydroxyacid dehydratase/phosphogluconate dehydratase